MEGNMTIGESQRHELFSRLEDVLGAAPAATLMSYLPPVGWADVATKQDLEALEAKFDAKFDTLEAKFDAKFDTLEAKFATLDTGLDYRFATVGSELEAAEHRILGSMRSEMITQTRLFIIAMVTLVLSTASLTFAASHI